MSSTFGVELFGSIAPRGKTISGYIRFDLIMGLTRIVHQVQVDIVKAEFLQRDVHSFGYIFGCMLVIPKLEQHVNQPIALSLCDSLL